jgi:Protein of unknown function (DUF2510)
MTESSPPAGWYPDPSGTPGQRYFDGTDWTEHRSDLPANRTMSDDQRAEILNQALATAVARGGRIESHSRFQAVVVRGRPVNHVLHAILTLFTCLWGIVWLIVGTTGGERREVVQVDPYGNVISSGYSRSR